MNVFFIIFLMSASLITVSVNFFVNKDSKETRRSSDLVFYTFYR